MMSAFENPQVAKKEDHPDLCQGVLRFQASNWDNKFWLPFEVRGIVIASALRFSSLPEQLMQSDFIWFC